MIFFGSKYHWTFWLNSAAVAMNRDTFQVHLYLNDLKSMKVAPSTLLFTRRIGVQRS